MLSPCKVREYIEFQLDLPQSEVVNKSQTTLNTSNCASFENTDFTLASSKNSSQNKSVLAIQNFSSSISAVSLTDQKATFQNIRNLSVSLTPYYILYRNFKVYP